MTSTTDRARLIGFVAASGVRRVFARVGGVFAGGLPFDGRAQARLLIAPHDLRTADPTIAGDIYRGRFSLSGTAATIGATSPFLLNPPSRAWEEELLSFSWLRHLHAADDAVSRVHARALIADWIALQGRGHPIGWQPHVVSRRIIAWLAHSPLYLTNAEPDFYRSVMRSLGRQLRHLARHVHVAPDGVPRLTAQIAMAYATLCISGLERLQARAVRQLAEELDRQVLPDGGHISRDPGAILELLLDLLPLRQTFLSRDVVPPQALIGAIDRMMPMVRFFRHSDGSFGLFNGMGRTPIGAISAVLAYDDSRGRPADQAPHSGYQRLDAGGTVMLMDVGRPPPPSVSHNAHAGCLAIELSSGKDRIFVNCGTAPTLTDAWRQAARTTAAHSTVAVADVSSCRFISGGPLARLFGTPIVSGPREVEVGRQDTDEWIIVEARHDGYRRLGLIHHRRVALARDGDEIEGQDRLTRSSALFSRTRPYSIRFHLHPAARATLARDSRSLSLALPSRQTWRFAVFGASLRLEESVFLADPKGARRTAQVVISGQCGNEALIRWTLRREGSEHAPRVREVREGEREEQVMPQTVDPTAGGAAPETPGRAAPQTGGGTAAPRAAVAGAWTRASGGAAGPGGSASRGGDDTPPPSAPPPTPEPAPPTPTEAAVDVRRPAPPTPTEAEQGPAVDVRKPAPPAPSAEPPPSTPRPAEDQGAGLSRSRLGEAGPPAPPPDHEPPPPQSDRASRAPELKPEPPASEPDRKPEASATSPGAAPEPERGRRGGAREERRAPLLPPLRGPAAMTRKTDLRPQQPQTPGPAADETGRIEPRLFGPAPPRKAEPPAKPRDEDADGDDQPK